ncbi:2,3-bisphosphoglycerate-independent phosphoglycerate mutase [soil metagenome]
MILDGWGLAPDPSVSAIDQADTPFIDSLYKQYPHATLKTSGLDVGLPDGQMGNSEVGHMNIGAGRVVYQMLVRINKAMLEGEIDRNTVLLDALQYAKTYNKKVHLLGLVSDGGVHSHIDHLKGLLRVTKEHGPKDVFIHAFMDGRDTDPQNGIKYLKDLQLYLRNNPAKIASIIGRYYAMDRDKRWERVKLAYDLLVHNTGNHFIDPILALESSYAAGITDEFIKPIAITDGNNKPLAKIEEGDVVLLFNFRTDRGRELTEVLSQQAHPEYGMAPLSLRYLTMTTYDESFKGVEILFDTDNLEHTLGQVLAENGKTQLRIAETEKYPHVTFFFNGGREEPFVGEERIMCPSPKVATYDMKPEMSAYDLRDALVPKLREGKTDFVCLNFANADMVGHTGVFDAAVKACETVDACARDVVAAALDGGYTTIIIADHGNSDVMINPDGSPNTAHTTNPVPFIMVGKDYQLPLTSGRLGDLAPTILELMDIPIPPQMTGTSLLYQAKTVNNA